MPGFEVQVTASFFVQADSKEDAGHRLDHWWRLFNGADVDRSYQMRQEGAILPRRWTIGPEEKLAPDERRTQVRQVQDLMNRHRSKFKIDAESVKLIEDAEHDFEDL